MTSDDETVRNPARKGANEILWKGSAFFGPDGARPPTEVVVTFVDADRGARGRRVPGQRDVGVVELQPDAVDAAGSDGAGGAVVGRAGDGRRAGAVGPRDDGGAGARRARLGPPPRRRGRLRAAGGEPLRGDAAGRVRDLRVRTGLPAGLQPGRAAGRDDALRGRPSIGIPVSSHRRACCRPGRCTSRWGSRRSGGRPRWRAARTTGSWDGPRSFGDAGPGSPAGCTSQARSFADCGGCDEANRPVVERMTRWTIPSADGAVWPVGGASGARSGCRLRPAGQAKERS